MIKKFIITFICIVLLLIGYLYKTGHISCENNSKNTTKINKPKYVRAIHLTAWIAGSKKWRKQIQQLMDETELNTLVIDVKEYEGEVYVPEVKLADELKSYVDAVPDIESYIKELKSKKIYTVARIVVFKDDISPRKNKQWAVKTPGGNLWTDYKGITWLDPYCRDNWEYNLSIASRCAELGFDEIQFDYIRFPSDGNYRECRYSQHHTSTTAVLTISGFLKEAYTRLKPAGVNVSVDMFGLTSSAPKDMGIGQTLVSVAEYVDFICPMVYPSHYANGTYGIADPNKHPYEIVFISLKAAKERLGKNFVKLRPYLQDFTLGYKYKTEQVLAQIQACYDNDIPEWTLWNARGLYTRKALKSPEFADTYQNNANLTLKPTAPVKSDIPKESSIQKNSTGYYEQISSAPTQNNTTSFPQ